MEKTYLKYRAEIISDETADGKHGERIYSIVGPLNVMPKGEDEVLDFISDAILNGCTKEFIVDLLISIRQGDCPNRIYNFYVIDPNELEVEEYCMGFFLEQILEYYLEKLNEEEEEE